MKKTGSHIIKRIVTIAPAIFTLLWFPFSPFIPVLFILLLVAAAAFLMLLAEKHFYKSDHFF